MIRCEICGFSLAKHGPGNLGRVYAAPFGWHTFGGAYAPAPPGYRPRGVDLSIPSDAASPGEDAIAQPIRDPHRVWLPESLDASPGGKTKSETRRSSVDRPRPKAWWGRWRTKKTR